MYGRGDGSMPMVLALASVFDRHFPDTSRAAESRDIGRGNLTSRRDGRVAWSAFALPNSGRVPGATA
jgi:hypothetical protein